MCLKVYMPVMGTCKGCDAAVGGNPHPYSTNVNQTWAWNATVHYDAERGLMWFYGGALRYASV